MITSSLFSRYFWTKNFTISFCLVGALTLSACGSVSGFGGGNLSASQAAAGYRVGDPYQIRGAWYYPKEDFGYDETGTASWYGNQFNGRSTASGEIFNSRAMTAAHPTLPMPSIVRVTNLDNGRTVVLRVNDRGPFTGGRIIDVSKTAAERLGFMAAGTARVRVQIMAEESRTLKYASSSNPGSNSGDRGVAVPRSSPRGEVATIEIDRPTSSSGGDPVVVTRPQSGAVYIQTGSYIEYDNAVAARGRVSDLDLGPTQIQEASVNGQRFYRVRIGPIRDERAADTILARSARRIPGAIVVTD